MKTSSNKDFNQETETHPLLPSGEWVGFYCYHHNSEQYKMLIELFFSNSVVSGSGVDDVSSFTWTGKYDLENFKIAMTKHYSTHTVEYKGDIDENGIWGIWEINHDFSKVPQHLVPSIKEAFKNDLTGGFHIWPKKSEKALYTNSLEEQMESEKLNELFSEVFASIEQPLIL